MNPAIAIIGFFLLFTSCTQKSDPTNRPNIVFIFADDQSYNTIKALGGDEVYTPNLDQLARNGVSFSNCFNMGGWNGAICIASRTMLFTGKYIWKALEADSLMDNNAYDLPLWSEIMEEAGYDTYMSGKWHIKKPAEEVFKKAVHVRPGMPNQTDEGYNRPLSPTDTLWRPWDQSKNGFWKGGRHWSDVLGDDAIAFLDSASLKNDPFFMYLAFNAPHDPRQSPEEFVRLYPLDSVAVPVNFLAEYPYSEEMGSGRDLRDEKLAPFPRTEYAIKVNRQEYYAIISHMDKQVGRIIEALRATGKMENTYVVFSADHGLSVGQHGLLGKQSMYDHSVRAPLLVTGPGIPKNEKIDAEVYVQDIMPSVLEMAGIELPDFVDFHSFLPLILSRRSTHYPGIYGCYTMTQRMIRSDGYKLIVYPQARKLRLFDLTSDPYEINDLADNPTYKTLREKLWKELLLLQVEMSDPLDLEAHFPDL